LKKTFIIAGSGLLLAILIFQFGRTTEPVKPVVANAAKSVPSFDIQGFISDQTRLLSASAKLRLDSLSSNPDNLTKTRALADFWKDSSKAFEPYIFYTAQAAKLDNSEKNVTFAAQLFLEALRMEQNEAKLEWESAVAIDLFQRAIQLNPQNDDLKIGLGSCYIYGRGRSGDPQETMKGIQEILEVARKDSTNMKAQLMLGVGGLVSGQYDKAIVRFNKVIEKEPANLEAVAYLADAYAASGNKGEAIRWYTISKRLANNPHYSEEVDKRIKSLQ
jgi:tetratricopeptide (TPR) repeat protein